MTPRTAEPDTFADSVRQRFGAEPAVVARAPGRVNLIGEHVDYCGGCVLPVALAQSCLAAIVEGAAKPGACVISSSGAENEVRFSTLETPHPGRDAPIGSWASYVLGAVAGVAEKAGSTDALSGCRIHVESTVPLGGGLSSSAALEVSVATAVAAQLGVEIGGLDLARLCQRAEHEFAGMPCGLMDQAISVLGKAGHALLLDCATRQTELIPIPDSARFLVFNSGVKHELTGGEYAARRELCERSAKALGVKHLAHATLKDAQSLDKELRPAARHVVTENARVHAACAALRSGDLPEFGRLMNASHVSMRDDFRISCDEIDTLVESLQACDAVVGARMTGGGFGGCVVALVEPGAEEAATEAAENARAACPNMTVVDAAPSDGAARIR